MEETNPLIRYAICGSLIVATGIAITCPCRTPFLSCHIKEFTIAAGLPLVVALYLNYA